MNYETYVHELITLDLTHVQYSPTDPWGAYWALITLSPVLILTVYIAVFMHRRELTYLNALLGQIVCEYINLRLKKRIKQPRPTNVLGTGYGMPSSHSQFSGFFCAFWCLHILLHWPRKSNTLARSYQTRCIEQCISLSLVVLTTGLTCYSRHYLAYHTPAQIVVGCTLGLVVGTLYYMLTEFSTRFSARGQALRAWLHTTRGSRALRLYDGWTVWTQGPVEVVYTHWVHALEQHRKQRSPATKEAGTHPAHLRMMLRALQEADHCEAVPTAFSVGCVIAANAPQLEDIEVPLDSEVEPLVLTTGYSRELPGNTHAEECALDKLRRHCAQTPHTSSSAEARSRTPLSLILYTTMEPCSQRLSGNRPCVQRIQDFNADPPLTSAAWLAQLAQDTHTATSSMQYETTTRPLRIVLVVQGVQEPDDFVLCESTRMLRDANVMTVSATPAGSPAMLGLTCPPLASIAVRVDAQAPTKWLEEACLRMARKGQ